MITTAVDLLKTIDEVRTVIKNVIRGGKKVRIRRKMYARPCPKGQKRTPSGGCRRISSKEKAAIRRLGSSSSIGKRRRSMAKHRSLIHNSADESQTSEALLQIEFDPEVFGDDLSAAIDVVTDAVQGMEIDFSVDDPDTIPIEVSVPDEYVDMFADALSVMDGITIYQLEDEYDDTEMNMDSGNEDGEKSGMKKEDCGECGEKK